MSGKEGARIFIGGLSWDTTERQLGNAFSRFGQVLDVQIMVQRDTGRPRGFGFVTFSDKRAMEAAISEMHNKEFGGRQISVNKAEPKVSSDDTSYGYGGGGGGGYSSGGKGGYRGHADDSLQIGLSECFKCGCVGHLACECPSDGGERFSSRSRINGGGGRGDRNNERWRYDGGRYNENHYRYNGGRGRGRYASNHYLSAGDHFSGEPYGNRPDKYPSNRYNNKRSFNKNGGSHGGGGGGGCDNGHRYGSGGPTRYDGGGNYQERPGPYGRPGRGSRPASFDHQY